MFNLASMKNMPSTGSIKRMIVLFTFLLISSEISAAAFCALRDPIDPILNLFPDYTSSRSLVRNVSDDVRRLLRKHLTFEFHYKEFGKHTLYVVFNDNLPIGLIHVRPEKGQWGINEIVWALDMDFNIIGFKFQRCRCINKNEVESTEFMQFLHGQSWESLSRILSADADDLNGLPANISDEGRSLAMTVIRSAIKVSLATLLVWGKDLDLLLLPSKARDQMD